MAKTMQGDVKFGEFETLDQYDWNDPVSGKIKPLRSLKILQAHGDKTITRVSISLPEGHPAPSLTPGSAYGFPVKNKFNKKHQRIDYELRTDMAPFPAPEVG